MQVGHGLAGLRAAVGHHAEVADAQTLGDGGDDLKDVGHHTGVLGGDLTAGGDVLLGDHQEVDRSLRVDVVEGKDALVLVHLAGGDLPRGDLTKQTIGHNVSSTLKQNNS